MGLCRGIVHTHMDRSPAACQSLASQTAFSASKRKACGTHRDGKTGYQAEQQHSANSAGHTITDSREKLARGSPLVFWSVPFG